MLPKTGFPLKFDIQQLYQAIDMKIKHLCYKIFYRIILI